MKTRARGDVLTPYPPHHPKKIKKKMFEIYDRRGAEYPSEHNVGHEYVAKKDLLNFYKKLDPTNSFNSGIGFSSKNKFWK